MSVLNLLCLITLQSNGLNPLIKEKKYVPDLGANEPFTNHSDHGHNFTPRKRFQVKVWPKLCDTPQDYFKIFLQMVHFLPICCSWNNSLLSLLHWLGETIFVRQYVFKGNIFWWRFPFQPVGVIWLTVSRQPTLMYKKPNFGEKSNNIIGELPKAKPQCWTWWIMHLWQWQWPSLKGDGGLISPSKLTVTPTNQMWQSTKNEAILSAQIWKQFVLPSFSYMRRWHHTVTLWIKLSLTHPHCGCCRPF